MKLFGRRSAAISSPSSPSEPSSPKSPSRRRFRSSSSKSGRKSVENQRTRGASRNQSAEADAAAATSAPDDYEMVKRRVRVSLAILERPLMTETEFLVDARYRSVKLIGSGAYGIVCSAIDSVTRSKVAIKKILNAFSHIRLARRTLREIRLLHHLNHPHIVRLLDIDVPQQYRAWDSVYIVTTLLDMDLKTAMRSGKIDTPYKQKKVAYQMLLGLEHMHSLGLMHRDVKSRNLLVDKDLNLQLCDLGESRFYSGTNRYSIDEYAPCAVQDEPNLSGVITTMIQSAPEISLGADYDAGVDIWAAGCVIAELVHKEHEYLFDSTSKRSHVKEIIEIVGYSDSDIEEALPEQGRRYVRQLNVSNSSQNRMSELLGPGIDPLALDLITKMLRFSPKKRLSAKRALQHPWFDEVRENNKSKKGAYKFSQTEPHSKTSKSELKNLVWEEVVAFHPEAPHLGVR